MNENAQIADLQQQIALYEDMKAYKQLYGILYERLFWFSCSFVKSREAAEEIVSDVFIKLWRIRNSLNTVDNLVVLLYVITKNLSLNYIRKHNKNPKVSLDEVQWDGISAVVNPEDLCISNEMQNRIREAIRALPSQRRLIFQMVREDGLKHKEVAGILNISEITVRNQLAIAAKTMMQVLRPYLRPGTVKKGNGIGN